MLTPASVMELALYAENPGCDNCLRFRSEHADGKCLFDASQFQELDYDHWRLRRFMEQLERSPPFPFIKDKEGQ